MSTYYVSWVIPCGLESFLLPNDFLIKKAKFHRVSHSASILRIKHTKEIKS